MKAITLEWFARAHDDLGAARALLNEEELTNMVAFHAQQAVEKALKAAVVFDQMHTALSEADSGGRVDI